MPLSEPLLPARLGIEPRLAVTGLVIVCILAKVDGGTRCLERACEPGTGCGTWLQAIELIYEVLRSNKGCLRIAVC